MTGCPLSRHKSNTVLPPSTCQKSTIFSGAGAFFHFSTNQMESLPSDPFILLSFINTRLRDEYPSLDALCDDLGVSPSDVIAPLEAIGMTYMPEINQFR